jgi:NADH-quinone oxidoreductase subunit N
LIPTPELDLGAALPLLFLAGGAFSVLLAELWLTARGTGASRAGTALVALSGASLLLVVIAAGQGFAVGGTAVFNPSHPLIELDRFANFSMGLVATATLFVCMLSTGYLQELRIHHGEYFALLLLSAAGMVLLVAAVDLLSVFLGVELTAIPLYVLAGFDRRELRSNESALKYFLVGSFASALMLYGMALVYGATGATGYSAIAAGLDPESPLAMIGVGLVVVGFGFKIASVPFHQWAPDVYEGAPTSVTAFMAATVKVAACAALLRLVVEAFGAASGLQTVFAGLAALSMVVGNLMAVIQDSVKRMLAYSSIAHAGYLLVPFAAGTPEAWTAVLFYLMAYSVTTVGVFGVVIALTHRGRDADRFEDYEGLGSARPGMAALLLLFLISLAGIPGTAGFMGKLQIFMAAVAAEQVGLAILMALTSVVSLFYYLRLPVAMYMRPLRPQGHRSRTDFLELVVLGACAGSVLLLGLAPNRFGWLQALDWTRAGVDALMAGP